MRKKHSNESGYIAERYNPNQSGHKIVIYNGGTDLKYTVSCKQHGCDIGATSVPRARGLMKTPATWCQGCGAIACHTPSEAAPTGRPAVIRFDRGNEYVHIGALLASLAIDPTLGHTVMQAVKAHCNDIDNILHDEVGEISQEPQLDLNKSR